MCRFCYTICVVSVIQFVDLPVMEVHPVLQKDKLKYPNFNLSSIASLGHRTPSWQCRRGDASPPGQLAFKIGSTRYVLFDNLHCLGAVRERKSGIGILLYNSYTAYIQSFKLFVQLFERLIFVLVEEGQCLLSFKWLYCCAYLFDHFISQ